MKKQQICITSLKLEDTEIALLLPDEYSLGVSEKTVVHYHIFFEIHFVLEGECVVKTSSRDIPCPCGSVIIIPPHTKHIIYQKDSSATLKRYCLSFSLPKKEEKEKKSALINSLSAVNEIVVLRKNSSDIIERTISALNSEGEYSELMVEHSAALLFLDIVELLSEKKKRDAKKLNAENPHKHRASQIIDTYFTSRSSDRDASLGELSNLLHLSERQTERKLLKLTGRSFKALLLEHRMTVARDMILNSNIKLSEVAYNVGYSSYDVFFKAFTKHFGFSPSSLRLS